MLRPALLALCLAAACAPVRAQEPANEPVNRGRAVLDSLNQLRDQRAREPEDIQNEAQEVRREGPVRITRGPRIEDERASYRLAVNLLANGRLDEATALLEDLYAEDPTAVAVWLKLEEAYLAARRFDDAVAHIDAWIARAGPSVSFLSKRGTALSRAGRDNEARQAWADAIALDPDDPQAYRRVASEIGGLRLYDQAAEVLASGRERLGDAILPVELAHLYGLALDYDRAATLYLDALAEEPQLRATVQSRLTRLLSGRDAPAIFGAAIDRAAALDPLNRAYRELQAWLALEQGDYDRALDAVRALDRLEAEEGQSLVQFAEQAVGAGASGAAARALDEVLTRHPTGPAASRARFERTRLWDAQAREAAALTAAADSARAGYLRYLADFPADDFAPASRLQLAELLADVFREFDRSEEVLRQAAQSRNPVIAARARLRLGDVAIQRGDLAAARAQFQDVDQAVRIGPIAEQARYELALIDVYEGFMYSALARVEALDENTAADASNDAIALRVTLSEALGGGADLDLDLDLDADRSDEPLHVYGRAALRFRQGAFPETLATLDSLDAALTSTAPLADESLYLRAAVQFAQGEDAVAVATLDKLLVDVPSSYFGDRALRRQAEAFEGMGDPGSAADRYDRLLERYPGSPLAPAAREALRRLRSSPS
ncbi:tetratricopeptide repeat protein [Rubrivirga sp. IMCC43871]|uniref:tetratricopeptide repeat protein n=1 Tax=Rubrivirga sp. IMCC43871 TaxID=3391575 RepID=UPI00398FA90E